MQFICLRQEDIRKMPWKEVYPKYGSQIKGRNIAISASKEDFKKLGRINA